MIKPVVKDPIFLAQKSTPATMADLPVARYVQPGDYQMLWKLRDRGRLSVTFRYKKKQALEVNQGAVSE